MFHNGVTIYNYSIANFESKSQDSPINDNDDHGVNGWNKTFHLVNPLVPPIFKMFLVSKSCGTFMDGDFYA